MIPQIPAPIKKVDSDYGACCSTTKDGVGKTVADVAHSAQYNEHAKQSA
jgi:hypothetical protein